MSYILFEKWLFTVLGLWDAGGHPPAFWAFLWFVGFCYLANQWQVSKPKDNPLNEGTDAARAAIAFSFFSIFTWVSTQPARPTLTHRARLTGRGLPA